MGRKPVYKIMDESGRVLIPKEIRAAVNLSYGDIVRLGVTDGNVSVQKVELIEVGDQSPAAVEAFVRSAFKTMPDHIRISLISDLTGLLQQKEEE